MFDHVLGHNSAALIDILVFQEALYSAADKEKRFLLEPSRNQDALREAWSAELDNANQAVAELMKFAEDLKQRNFTQEIAGAIADYEKAGGQVFSLEAQGEHIGALSLALGDASDLRRNADAWGDDLRAYYQGHLSKEISRVHGTGRDTVIFVSLAFIVAVGAGTIALVFAMIVKIIRPLRAMTIVMGKIAAGDLTVEIPAENRRDEVGAIATSVRVFRDGMASARDLRQQRENDIARQEQRSRTLDELTERFQSGINALMRKFSDASAAMERAAFDTANTAAETSLKATAVSSASEKTSLNVKSVATATEQFQDRSRK